MASVILKELESGDSIYVYSADTVSTELTKFFMLAAALLPDHAAYLKMSKSDWAVTGMRRDRATSIVNSVLELIEFERATQEKISEQKLFASAEEKMKEAAKSFSSGDFSSTLNNLNTALELALKDKLDIPTTITTINTSKILDILISNKVGPYLFMDQVKKHVLQVDNKVKHQAYNPSKIDCVSAIKSMEDLMAKLRNVSFTLAPGVRDSIYDGL